jgi:hypothetical protein
MSSLLIVFCAGASSQQLLADRLQEESEDEEEITAPPLKVAKTVGMLTIPAGMRKVTSRTLPFLADHRDKEDVRLFEVALLATNNYMYAELMRMLNDIGMGWSGGLVCGRSLAARSTGSGTTETLVAVDSSDRSFSRPLSYLERSVLSSYLSLVAKCAVGVEMGTGNKSIVVTTQDALNIVVPPTKIPNQGVKNRRNKNRYDNPQAPVSAG